jgi:hypothetical protein
LGGCIFERKRSFLYISKELWYFGKFTQIYIKSL